MEKMECLEEKEHGRFKMNPPIRGKDDKQALLTAIADGTIDMIATDHAPHSAEEKSKGFAGSLNGILGLEAAFPVMYTSLVETKIISLERLIELMSIAPARRFGLCGQEKQDAGADGQFDTLVSGARADITVIDLNEAFTIDPEKFMSKGRSTPFSGMAVRGKIKYTIADGKIVFANDQILKSDLR
jgi:dihydroorotase